MQKKKNVLDLKGLISEGRQKISKIRKSFTRRWKKTAKRKTWNSGMEVSFGILIGPSRKIIFEPRLDGCES